MAALALPFLTDPNREYLTSNYVRLEGTYEDAIKAGYQKYKLEPFLVKHVRSREPVLFISRNVVPSRNTS